MQSGQKELFSLLTKISMDTITQSPLEPQIGICEVLDPRLTKLIDMYKPKKKAYAKIEYLLPGLHESGADKNTDLQQFKERRRDLLCLQGKLRQVRYRGLHFGNDPLRPYAR